MDSQPSHTLKPSKGLAPNPSTHLDQIWAKFLRNLSTQTDTALHAWFHEACKVLSRVTCEEELIESIHLLMPSTFECVWERLTEAEQGELQRIVEELDSCFGDLQPYFEAHTSL
jgi:hypothetical protein